MIKNNISILQWGDIPETSLVDEVGFAVKSLAIKPSREKKTYKGAGGAIFGARYINPMITFSFVGIRAAFDLTVGAQNLGYQHPGTAVPALLNFTDDIRGFDPEIGVMIYEDPEDTFDGENPAETKFDVVQYPFIASGTYVEIA